MGEATRRNNLTQFPNQHHAPQPQQIQVDLKDATPKLCPCGCKLFQPAIMCYTVSALLSPTGQELLAQQPILLCMDCKLPLEVGK
jgi:hypothetical protein